LGRPWLAAASPWRARLGKSEVAQLAGRGGSGESLRAGQR
jgi:hypothetical protein